MQAFAGLIMRGRLAAMLVVAVAALLPLLLWVSGAALALVTLRRGLVEGLITAAGATLVLGVVSSALVGTPAPALQPVMQLWLPMLVAAACLRQTLSLPRTLELCAGLATAAATGFHVVVAQPADYWRDLFERARSLLAVEFDPQVWQALVDQLAPVMTGLWFVNLLSLVIGSLLLGRWWQALLYNPGGFRGEFHGLRLSLGFAAVAIVLLVGAALTGPGLVYDAAMVLSSVFVLQTLAVAHAVLAQRGWSGAWLIGLYLMLPFALRLVTVFGIMDVFVDVRRRVADRA